MKKVFATAMLAVALTGAASAQNWDEATNGGGDAGDLPPGQFTIGNGALTTITGFLDLANADMFAIRIVNPGGFSATTVNGATWDTQLFLFDSSGMGVSFNDDDPGGAGLQSTLTGAFVPAPGLYYLAISSYDFDANSAGGAIWNDTPFDSERAPDGPGAGSPISSWSGSDGSANGNYTIFLTGAEYGRPIPAPGAIALLGLAGFASRRRRRA